MGSGDCHTVHNQGFSFLIITQPGRTFFFVFIKLPKVIHWPERARFTAEDAEREAAKLFDLPISQTVLFGELWQKRIRGQLIALEEVVFDHWHFGRIAILGDSAHKVPPLKYSLNKHNANDRIFHPADNQSCIWRKLCLGEHRGTC